MTTLSRMIMILFFALTMICCSSMQVARRPAQNSPVPICNITEYGAKGNGAIDTDAIQAAVNACSGRDGIVVIPSGSFTTGTIRLGSHMTFRLEAGAVLNGARDKKVYPTLNPPTDNKQLLNCRRALIYAEAPEALTIEGPGVIDGNGDFDKWQNIATDDQGELLDKEHIFKEAQRPMAIFIVQGKNLKIQNLQVKRAAMWAVVLMESAGAQVSFLSVNSQVGEGGGTRDGLDIVDGSSVYVDQTTIRSEDDSICLKSGIESGLSDVWVTNSHVAGSLVANGLKFGTASVGPLKNIHFENIVVEHVAQAAMAIESVDGSQINGVTFKGIKYNDTGSAIFVLLGWRGNQAQPHYGTISNITFENVQGVSQKQSWGSIISGTLADGQIYAPENINFQNVVMIFKGNGSFSKGHSPPPPPEYQGQYPDPQMWPNLPAEGLYFRHVKNITLINTKLNRLKILKLINSSDARPILDPDTGRAQFDAP